MLALLALCIAGSVQAILHPTGKNADTPVWLLVIDYLCMVDVWLVVIAYALLDKRWLRKRFAVLDRWHGWKLARLSAALIVGTLVVAIVATLIARLI